MRSKDILILTDYKGYFGSKQITPIYRGGLDVEKLVSNFSNHGFKVKLVGFTEIDICEVMALRPVILYTSSEDQHGRYKSFIEDVIYDLEQRGIEVIPSYSCLIAHNNKVAMELLRSRSNLQEIKTIHSKIFGTLEELKQGATELEYPVVVKTHAGAMSRGVAKADNKKELIKKAAKFSKSYSLRHDLKELLRKVKYRSRYVQESCYRTKFIVQNLIKGLDNDWKVLVYGNRCYALRRDNRENDFRASGSGKFIFSKDIPSGMLDFALKIRKHFNVPHISLDIAFDGIRFHLIEFQFIYFGTTTIEKSPHYFELLDGEWQVIKGKSNLEETYVDSIINYIDNEKVLPKGAICL